MKNATVIIPKVERASLTANANGFTIHDVVVPITLQDGYRVQEISPPWPSARAVPAIVTNNPAGAGIVVVAWLAKPAKPVIDIVHLDHYPDHVRHHHGYTDHYSNGAPLGKLRDEHKRDHEDDTAVNLDHTHGRLA